MLEKYPIGCVGMWLIHHVKTRTGNIQSHAVEQAIWVDCVIPITTNAEILLNSARVCVETMLLHKQYVSDTRSAITTCALDSYK